MNPSDDVEALVAAETAAARARGEVLIGDFYAYMPQHAYLYVPSRDLWPAASVNGRIKVWPTNTETGKAQKPSDWLDANRPVEQMTWHPDHPLVVKDRIVAAGGWSANAGSRVFNLYRAPEPLAGDAGAAGPWREHLARIYPSDAAHIERWLAHRVQRPGEKINHALVLGGTQGVGKDTVLEPVKAGVGPWNWQDISPVQMLGRFNGWAKAVVVRISEARDLGDVDRFAFYDHSKAYIAAPPDVIRVDEKNIREHPVFNVMGVIVTTNHKTDGIYLPEDDRRHYVAWSDADRGDFPVDYWRDLYAWYGRGGTGHVVAYLRGLDLAGFDPKAPPPRTDAFYAIVQASGDPEDAALADTLDRAGRPDAVTLDVLIDNAEAAHGTASDIVLMLRDRRHRRALPHKLDRAGYLPVRNPDAGDGLWKIDGRRQVVYAKRGLTSAAQAAAARRLIRRAWEA